MIHSTSSSDRTARADSVSASGLPVARLNAPRPDRLSTESAAALHDALAADPEVRPAVVARARALVADPAYPPMSVLKRVAEQIVASPDLSEDES
ncbi:MAG: hypothetical protein JWM32_1527 [Verrucomicrobia bacterium]|nr:hypothetical protein [Verrucomicrobiota bacterium]